MSAFKDLTGQRFRKLTVIKRVENEPDGRARWLCSCDCGNTCVVAGVNLRSGVVSSCGCLRKGVAGTNLIHGLSHTKIQNIYTAMKQRCCNPNDKKYHWYGGRGIKVCDRWLNGVEFFYNDVSKLPHFGEKGYSLDRIDNNGDYCPENVRWVTAAEQQRNQSDNIWVEYNGEKMCLADAADKSGINYGALYQRYKSGKRGESLFRPVQKHKHK